MKRIRSLSLTLVLLLLSASAAAAQPAPKVQVHYINVGQAEAVLLELKTAAILIDAGGEDTGQPGTPAGDRDKDRLIGYLNRFFARRTDLNRTLYSVVVSHPHLDHTRLIMDVLNAFTVGSLIDGGNRSGSGIGPLQEARDLIRQRGGVYTRVTDERVREQGREGYVPRVIGQLLEREPGLDLKFVSGARGGVCADANNDSLTLRMDYRGSKFLFSGDSETEDSRRRCSGGQVALMVSRFDNPSHDGLLDVDVYKVGHHGSHNGTSRAFMTAMSPRVAVISAGVPETRAPGEFHAFFFGHPRDSLVRLLEEGVGGDRPTPVSARTMLAVRRVSRLRQISRAVYCTCWDGNVVIEAREDGTPGEPQTNQ